ncbi:3-oxoacyl-[acyl-carrier-protein] synthase III C-terminal domain-containing protein [Bacillus smithii]|uniref:type III polyketide synthase n=1 Tax=Bacillus smithii TaxID=1479 RepID=UPI003D21DFCF
MGMIVAAGHANPDYCASQEEVQALVKQIFSGYPPVDRMLKVFQNAEIETRYFVKPIEWYQTFHDMEERNRLFVEEAVRLGKEAIQNCLDKQPLNYEDIEAIFTVCTTGLSTPSLEARIMNILPFSSSVKRIPIWGLGCAGGASGLARAFEYCKAFPKANVLVLAVELCSLTFQLDDRSKSNLIGTSLFGDGAACMLVCGVESPVVKAKKTLPHIFAAKSVLKKDALDVMGWDIRNNGLYVIFSKDIPTLVANWLKPVVEDFLAEQKLSWNEISHFIAHPGGKKVIQAYEEAFGIHREMTADAAFILRKYGNMSSPTIFYVLERVLKKSIRSDEIGLACALGPGFGTELLLMRWT